MALTAKKKAFAQSKHDGADNKQAAIFAGYSPESASQAGSRLAKDPDVIAHIERLKINTEVKDDSKPEPRPIITKKTLKLLVVVLIRSNFQKKSGLILLKI